MSKTAATSTIALCSAMPLPGGDTVPEWIHLLPAGQMQTFDGRGPYRVADVAKLIEVSMQGDARLPIDENHATDLAAPKGEPSPARGWIVALEQRGDGVWGKVEWTGSGKALLADKAYRHISPVIVHDQNNVVGGVVRASLVNRPNLRGLTALHQEQTMDPTLVQIREALGLPATADAAAVAAGVNALKASTSTTALQHVSQALTPIAKAVGLTEQATGEQIIIAIQSLQTAGKGDAAAQITALQTELTNKGNALVALQQTISNDRAVAFVDGAIKAGKISVKPLRDHYIAEHMKDPARVEKEIGALPALQASGTAAVPPSDARPGELTADESSVVAMMGIDPEAFKKTKAAQAAKQEAL